jgi:hypothetical protein
LDLIITNSPGYFVDSGIISPPSNCDHISFDKTKCYKRHIWELSRVDGNKLLNSILNAPWDVVFADIQNIDTLYNAWFDCF